MRYNSNNRYLAITKDNINKYIQHIMTARNAFIDEGKPVDDVNELLVRFMKEKKKLRA